LRSRPHIHPHAGGNRAYLTLREAAHIWDAASFLAQEYGVYLNTRVLVKHGSLGISTEGAAAAFNSQLLRRLSARLLDWTGHELHWLYVHSRTREESLTTTIAMHIPEDFVAWSEEWLFEWFLRGKFESFSANAVSFRFFGYPSGCSASP
jgi:DNA polymerase-3 subunit gamma/tau